MWSLGVFCKWFQLGCFSHVPLVYARLIRERVEGIRQPAPMVKWPISELLTCPSSRPTGGPEASRTANPCSAIAPNRVGMVSLVTALPG